MTTPDAKVTKGKFPPIDQPKHLSEISSGGWAYSLGEDVDGDSHPRGIYKEIGGTWRRMAPLPYVLERLMRRDSAGMQVGSNFRVSMSPAGLLPDGTPAHAVKISHDDLKDGTWGDRLGVPLSGDPKIVQAALTVIKEIANAAPAREIAPRVHEGELELPPADVGPVGYGKRAGDERQARQVWAELLDIAAGAPRLALTMAAAFGGLYIAPLRRQSFITLLVGDAGAGKTTALTAGASLFGAPGDGEVVKPWNTTVIAVCQELGGYGVLPAFRDELGTANSAVRRDLESLVFQITQGAQRTRGGRDGNPTTSAAWHGVMVASSNSSILGQVSNEGVARRVLEVRAPITRNAAEAERITELAHAAHGWPLHWLRERGMDIDGFRSHVKAAEDELVLPENGVARGLAKHFALSIAGADLLEEITGTTGLRQTVLTASRELLDEQITEITENGATAADRVYSAVVQAVVSKPAAYPTRNAYATALISGGESSYMAREVEGWLLTEDDYPGDFAVLTNVVTKICNAAGIDNPRTGLRDLEQRGTLIRYPGSKNDDPRRIHKLRVHGGWRPSVYIFRLDTDEVLRERPAPVDEPTDPGTAAALPQDQNCGTTAAQPAGAPPAAEVNPDDVLTYGTDGPVLRIDRDPAPCRICGCTSVVGTDDRGPVHPFCATGQAQAHAAAPPAPAQRPAARPAAGRRPRLSLCGVLDVDGLWLPGADRAVEVSTPADIAAAYRLAAANDLRQLWIHPRAHGALGIPETREITAKVGPTTPVEHEWASGDGVTLDPGGLAAWVNVAPADGQGRRIGIAFPAYDADRTDWHQASTGAVLRDAVLRYAALAEPFYMSVNETSAAMIRSSAGEDLASWPAGEVPEPAGKVKFLDGDSRVLTDEEEGQTYLHKYDINGAECSVNTGVWVGIGTPDRFELRLPVANNAVREMKECTGYLLANVPRTHPNLDPRLPNILKPWERVDDRDETRGGPTWVPVETLVLLDELGLPIEVHEALLFRSARRLLRPYGERMSKARYELFTADENDEPAAVALKVVKATYKSRIGDFNRAGSRIYRPDIRDAIIAKARANAFRALVKIGKESGRYPVAFHVDAAYYTSDEEDPILAAPKGMKGLTTASSTAKLGAKLGQWKPEDTLALVKIREHLAEPGFAARFEKIRKGR